MQACIVRVDFDPVGPDATMQGGWTVAGAAPTEETCGEIRFVRVRFFVGDGEHRDHPDLVFSCTAGAFDTRPSRVVSAGEWRIGLVAIRADGSVVEEGPTSVLDTSEEEGAHLVLPPFDFSSPG